YVYFFVQAEDGIRDRNVTGVQTCALPIWESYDQYPNLWMSSGYHFDDTRRVTDLHLDLHEQYNWGQAELVSWNSLDDGRELQGALIKPDNYEEDKEYPVLVYFYAHDFSQRAYEFNNITNDDRPTL